MKTEDIKYTQGEMEVMGGDLLFIRNVAVIATIQHVGDNEVTKANAERIVQCWNNYDSLLEALKFCQSVIKSQGMYDLSERMAYDKAEAAIQKAESE